MPRSAAPFSRGCASASSAFPGSSLPCDPATKQTLVLPRSSSCSLQGLDIPVPLQQGLRWHASFRWHICSRHWRCFVPRAQSWRTPGKPSPVLPSAPLPASLCGNSSNLRCWRSRVDFFPPFLEGVYSLDPSCYKLRNRFVISSLNLFLSSYLIMPCLQHSSLAPLHGDSLTKKFRCTVRTFPSLKPRQTLPVGPPVPPAHRWGSLLQQQRHGLTGIPIPRGPFCSTSSGTPRSWKVRWTLGFGLIHRGSSHQGFWSLHVLFFSFPQR